MARLLTLLLLSSLGALPPTWGEAASIRWKSESARLSVRIIDLDDQDIPDDQRGRILAQPGTSAAEVRAFFSNRTRLSFSADHGTQVAYSAPDGRIFLWYPGNVTILAGRWRVEEESVELRRGGKVVRSIPRASICFRYGANTYNLVTGQSGGTWSCRPLPVYRTLTRESRPGDLFKLARGGPVPFVLPRAPTTLAELRRNPATPDR